MVSYCFLKKKDSPCARVNIISPVCIPDTLLCAGAENSQVLWHDRAEGTIKLGMCYLNLTGCHLYLYPATISITTAISLTVY